MTAKLPNLKRRPAHANTKVYALKPVQPSATGQIPNTSLFLIVSGSCIRETIQEAFLAVAFLLKKLYRNIKSTEP